MVKKINFSFAEAADYLGYSVRHLRRIADRIGYRQERRGCKVVFSLESLEAYKGRCMVVRGELRPRDFYFSASAAKRAEAGGVVRRVRRVNGQVYLECVLRGRRPAIRDGDLRLVYGGSDYRLTVDGKRFVLGEVGDD